MNMPVDKLMPAQPTRGERERERKDPKDEKENTLHFADGKKHRNVTNIEG
jgi:hypothetical protein